MFYFERLVFTRNNRLSGQVIILTSDFRQIYICFEGKNGTNR
jgi:hypothetical protein